MSQLLSLTNFEFSYESEVPGAWRLFVPSFELCAGQVVIVSGDNMSGKSTLLSILGGMVSLQGCSGAIFGDPVNKHSQARLAAGSIVLSSDDKMFPELSVGQNIAIANRSLPFRAGKRELEAARNVLFGSQIIQEKAFEEPLGALSSGGRALVKLARAYFSSSAIVIVDEISSFLDAARAKYFLSLIIDLANIGRGVVIVSHSDRDRRQLLEMPGAICFHIHRNEDQSALLRLER